MSKNKKILSLILAIVMVFSVASVGIISSFALSEGEFHVVAGAAELCGSNWDPSDTNNQMTWNADKGIYEKVYTNVAAGTYDFKVTTGGSWDIADFNLTGDAKYGGPNATAEVTQDGSTVTIGFDGTKALLEITAGGGSVDPIPTTPVDPIPTTPVVPGETMTVYFENNWMWPDAKIYVWGGSAPAMEWPGVDMTYVDTTADGYDRYSIELPTDITGIVFSGTGGYGLDQSADVTEGWYDGVCFYMTYDEATNTKPCASYEYAPIGTEPKETEPKETEPKVTEPKETEPKVTETEPKGTDPVVTEKGVIVDGTKYDVTVGETLTYTFELQAARLFEDIQGTVTYDATKLELVRHLSDDPDVADWEVEGPIACPNLTSGLIYNAGIEGLVKFNATNVSGFNFKEEKVLITLEFKVLDDTLSTIDTVIEEMTIKGGEESYFTGGQQVITDGLTTVETLGDNGHITTEPKETEPKETEPKETEPKETEPKVTESTPVVGEDTLTIYIAGTDKVYTAYVGDKVTYTFDLEAARLFEDIQGKVTYDAAKLELVRHLSDDPDVADWEIEGPIACPNLTSGLIFNAGIEGIVNFNATNVSGFNFKQEKTLITLEFIVAGTGETTISTLVEEMTIKGGEDSYYTDGEPAITEGLVRDEYLDVPDHPVVPGTTVTEPKETEPKETEPKVTEPKETEPKETEPKETEPKETEPKETEPKETEPKETEPKETGPKETEPKETEPKVTEPKETEPKVTEPKETEPKVTEPKETEPKVTDPVATTTAPAPNTSDATGATGTPGTNGDAVDTGAAAYIYVAIAILTMAAFAVVVLRKRVNG